MLGVGDDVGVAGVGLGFPAVGLARALHGEARDIDDPLIPLPQQCQQKRRATSRLIDGPEGLSGEGEDRVYELEEIGLVVFDPAGEKLPPRVVESMRPMELLAHIDTDPEGGNTSYHRYLLHSYGLPAPVEEPADGSLRSESSPISSLAVGASIGAEGRFQSSHLKRQRFQSHPRPL